MIGSETTLHKRSLYSLQQYVFNQIQTRNPLQERSHFKKGVPNPGQRGIQLHVPILMH